MMRSFSYAAYAALFAFTVHAPDDYARARAVGRRLAALGGGCVPRRRIDATIARHARLRRAVPRGDCSLDAFVLDKALYELGYELNNRPDWVRIPLIGISEAHRDALRLADAGLHDSRQISRED